MPDLAMCQNEACTRKTDCYRYMAEPNGDRQCYALRTGDGKDCPDFMQLYKREERKEKRDA